MKYKVGMYGGAFNPLHLGHVDCIIQAANQCEHLFLVLSVGLKRAEIDEKIRYRWLYSLTQHIGNVTILRIYDEASHKEEYTEDLWLQGANEVKAQIKAKVQAPLEVVFVGSDYEPIEKSIWAKCYSECKLVVFPRNHISSTKIRANPFIHFNDLPDIVRSFYCKKVMIIGGESAGKSTLTINLKYRFNATYIEEIGRPISQRSGDSELMLSEDYTEILLRQKLMEIEALKQGKPLLFCDTDALVTQFYLHFFQDTKLKENIDLSNAIDALNDFDLILFLEPDVNFVQDGTRSEEIKANRQKYSEQIKDLLRTHHKNFIELGGDYQERYLKAVALVEQLLQS